MMMNSAAVPTAEYLGVSIRTWIGQKVHGLVVLPLLTAACQSLASVRHMAETTEACITAYFKESKRTSSSVLTTLACSRKSKPVVRDSLPLFPKRQDTVVILSAGNSSYDTHTHGDDTGPKLGETVDLRQLNRLRKITAEVVCMLGGEEGPL